MSIEVSVVIATRNRAHIIGMCLERLLDQTIPRDAYEVIVIDDASTDNTGEAVARFVGPNVIYLRQEQHKALSAARNRGIAIARGSLIVIMDDDALVRPDFLEQHQAAHREHPNAIVAGPMIDCVEPPTERSPPVGKRLGWHTNPFVGCNSSVGRQNLLDAGGYDEEFNMYGWEDLDAYRRLKMLGLSNYYAWKAPVWHYKPHAVKQDFFGRLRLEEMRGAMGALYYAKHRDFNVGFETKRHWLIDGLDRAVNAVLDLDGRIARARESGVEPASSFMRLLMINHTEIVAGRRKWEDLGPQRRAELAAEAKAKVRKRAA